MEIVPRSGSGTLMHPVQEYVDFTEAWLSNRRLSEHTRDAIWAARARRTSGGDAAS